MCGIVGFVDKKDRYSSQEKLQFVQRMREALAHRGRDHSGEEVHGAVALGHARLSILDQSELGKQPMTSPDKHTIIFNGEVYNFKEVAKEIGLPQRTGTDTEIILQAYEKWGPSCLSRLKGMWAFAILDRKEDSLFLSIDRFGIKPIYYISNDDFFAFASEIKALLTLPGIQREINANVLGEHLLFRSIAGDETLFKGIYKMLPGQQAVYDFKEQTLSLSTYWKLGKKEFAGDVRQKLLSLLQESVKEHLIADVPVGIQLSGGVDSSLVGALAAKEKHTGLHSFSIGLKDAGWNEFEYSRSVAQELRTVHHEIIFTEEEFCSLLPTLTYHMDEPIVHSHSIPMYLLARAAREYVKALLSGEGADEVFGGYRRYERLLGKTHTQQELVSLSQSGDAAVMHRVTSADFGQAYTTRRALIARAPDDWNESDTISFLDLHTYLTPLLIRQDKMGMAATLENRVPFLDHELVEFGFSLPEHEKLREDADPHKRTKPLLKEVAELFIPKEAIYRQKVGFGQPIAEWLRHEKGLGRFLRLLTDSPRTFLHKKEIAHLIKEHTVGTSDHSETLWTLLTLELWARIFIDEVKPEDVLRT